MSPIEIPPPDIPLPLPDGLFPIDTIGSYIVTVWELINQNSLITIAFLILVAITLMGLVFNLVTHRRNVMVVEEEDYRR
jgi:hypothetical protein